MADKNDRDEVRAELEHLVNLAKKLESVCKTTADLIAVCELAVMNDAQLELVLRTLTAQPKR